MDAPPPRTLVVLRHAKSDWSVPASDRDRPLAPRGRRQAPEAGTWLATHGPDLDLAVVSPATRAQQTWDLVRARLDLPVPTRTEEAVYTFDGEVLLAVVRRLSDERAVIVVSHNPAVEELVHALTGESVEMKTSSLAVIELDGWAGSGMLLAHGRPPAPPLPPLPVQ